MAAEVGETKSFPNALNESGLLENAQDGVEITNGYNEYETLLPLQTKKFTVFEVQKLGRILVAKKDFNMGDLVLREKPFMTFSSPADLVSQFHEMNEVEKAKLLSMHHLELPDRTMYPPCKKIMNTLYEQAKTMYSDIIAVNNVNNQSNHDLVTIDDTFQCLSVANLNAHSFHPTETEPDRAAFFPVAAIVAHSCQPNCIYSIGSNFFEFYAIEPIKKGDMFTSSYLDWNHLSQCNTSQRRIKLMESKDFYCLCLKCRDFDYSNGLICCHKNCQGISYGATKMSIADIATADHNKSSNKQSQITTLGTTLKGEICHWKCFVCGSIKTPLLAIIADIDEEYMNIHNNIDFKASDNNDERLIDALEILVSVASLQLSPTHFLITKMLLDLSDMYLRNAYAYENIDYVTATEYRYQYVEKLIQLIRINECIDAKCKHVKLCHSCSTTTSTATSTNNVMNNSTAATANTTTATSNNGNTSVTATNTSTATVINSTTTTTANTSTTTSTTSNNGSMNNTNHNPSIYNVPYVLKVCIHLNKCHKPLPDWILTYLPLLITFYGDSNTNSHIRNIKRSFGMSSENDDMRDKVSEFCQQS